MAEVVKAKEWGWGELKKRDGIMLTPTGREILKGKAEGSGITKSEFIERVIRVIPKGLVSEFDPEIIASLTEEECEAFFWKVIKQCQPELNG
jgi:hypothetical protein